MRTIAVANQKGGSGKTTTTVNLAAALGQKHRVLVVDLDYQAHSTMDLVGRDDDDESLLESLTEGKPLTITTSIAPGVDIVRSSKQLAAAEPHLLQAAARDTRLRRALQRAKLPYDFVLLDCPPVLGVMLFNALTAASEVLIPIAATSYGLDGVPLLLETMTDVRETNPKLAILAAVATMVDVRVGVNVETVEEIKRQFRGEAPVAIVHQSAAVLAASKRAHQPVQLYAPGSRAVDEYEALAQLVRRRRA